MENENKGAIAIMFKVDGGDIFYLLTTQESGFVNFVGGASEDADKNAETTIRREISEETSLKRSDYILQSTDFTHKFTYSVKKAGRTGKNWENSVFIVKVVPDLQIRALAEVRELKWYSPEDVIKLLRFEDLRDVFRKAESIIKEQYGKY